MATQNISYDLQVFIARERKVSQIVLEVAETPTTVERRVSQAVLEVAETPTTIERRVSQVILEIAYPPHTFNKVDASLKASISINNYIDSLISNILTISSEIDCITFFNYSTIDHDLDVLISNRFNIISAIDAHLLKTSTPSTGIEAILKDPHSYLYHNIDTYIEIPPNISTSATRLFVPARYERIDWDS